jgi:hypothetical protein
MECISGIEKYFDTKCIKTIMTDGKNLYIEFIPFKKGDSKLRKFISIIEDGKFEYNNKIFKISGQYYDV